MYFSAIDPLFWLFGILTACAIFISWYLPGLIILKETKVGESLNRSLVAISIGMVLWGLQGYLFGYLHTRWLTYVYVAIVLFFAIRNKKYILTTVSDTYKQFSSQPKIILISLFLATALQLIGHVGSGFLSDKGITFYFVNSVDGVMHLSYIQEIMDHFPPNEPGASGLVLKNYHYWGDLVTAELARIWHLPVLHLFFQYLPVVLILVTMQQSIQLIKLLKGSTATIILMLFLFTFGSDASYIFSYLLHRIFLMDIPVLDNGITFIFNMPQVFARTVLVSVFILIIKWVDSGRSNARLLLAIVLSIASLYGFKVYYGMYATIGFGFVTLYLLFKDLREVWGKQKLTSFFTVTMKNRFLFVAWTSIALLTATIYLPTNKDSGGLLFYPFEWPKLLLSAPQLDFTNWMLRMQLYEATHNYRNIAILYAVAVVMTLVCVHGTRLIGLFPLKHSWKYFPKELLWFVLPTNFIFLAIGMLFFQVSPTGGFNIYNFFLVPTFSFCLFTAFNLSMTKTRWFKYTTIVAVILMTLPRSMFLISEYLTHYQNRDKSEVVSNGQIELLTFIKNNTPTDAVLQSDPYNDYQWRTPYYSFFAERHTYYGGVELLDTHNQNTEQRKAVIKELFNKSARPEQIQRYMEISGIDYLVLTSPYFIEQYHQQSNGSKALEIVAENKKGLVIKRNE